MKLATLMQTLEAAKERENTLSKKVKADKALLESIAVTQNSFRDSVEHWTKGLVNIAAAIDEELA